MKHDMRKDLRIWLMLTILIVVALLATLWATSEPVGTPLERQTWGRWALNDEQKKEVEQLVRQLRAARASWGEIKAAVETKLGEWDIRQSPREDIELFYTVKTVISTINVTLLIFLLITYVDIYTKTKSNFTIGLIIFSMVLLFYALASNPLVHWIFGFRAFGLGPFAMLPDLFTCVALSVLLYLTLKY